MKFTAKDQDEEKAKRLARLAEKDCEAQLTGASPERAVEAGIKRKSSFSSFLSCGGNLRKFMVEPSRLEGRVNITISDE